MKELKRVGVLSVGKVFAAICAIIGLFFGLMYGIVFGFTVGIASSAILGVVTGLFMMILTPIGFGVMGFIEGVIIAAIYNLIAGKIGGIELEFKG